MTKKKESKKRVLYLDIARGISILLMIIGHVVEKGIKRSIIFSFHMPLFIIISGIFYKEKSFKEELKNLLIKLIIPSTLIVFVVVMIENGFEKSLLNTFLNALKTVTVCWSHQSKITYNFSNVDVLWFIYLLAGIRLLFLANKMIAKNNELLLFIIILVESYAGYLIGINGYWLPWSFDVLLACMLFYYVGYILGRKNHLNQILSNKWCLTLLLLVWIAGINYNSIEIAMRIYPGGLWSYIVAISGVLIVFKISMFIEKHFKYISSLLAWFGKNSLYILIGHYIDRGLIKYNISIDNKTLFKYVMASIRIVVSTAIGWILIKINTLIYKKHR